MGKLHKGWSQGWDGDACTWSADTNINSKYKLQNTAYCRGNQDTDKQSTFYIANIQNSQNNQSKNCKQSGSTCKVKCWNRRSIRYDCSIKVLIFTWVNGKFQHVCVLQSDKCDKETNTNADCAFQFHWDCTNNRFTHTGYCNNDKQTAGNKDCCQSCLPAVAH